MAEKSLIQSGGIIEQVGVKMTQLKAKNKKITTELNTIVEKSTEKEKKALEEASKAYNKKLEKVLNHPSVKQKMEERWNCVDDISDLTMRIQSAFKKAVREINRQAIDDKDKADRIKKLGDTIENVILDDDEKKIMKLIKDQMRTLPC